MYRKEKIKNNKSLVTIDDRNYMQLHGDNKLMIKIIGDGPYYYEWRYDGLSGVEDACTDYYHEAIYNLRSGDALNYIIYDVNWQHQHPAAGRAIPAKDRT